MKCQLTKSFKESVLGIQIQIHVSPSTFFLNPFCVISAFILSMSYLLMLH